MIQIKIEFTRETAVKMILTNFKSCIFIVLLTNHLEASNLTYTNKNEAQTSILLNPLNGKNIRVVITDMLPYVQYNSQSKKLDGFLGDIWNDLQTSINFTSTFTVRSEYDAGLKLMYEGKGDVMLGAVVAQIDDDKVQYTQPLFLNWYHLYMKKPKTVASPSSYLRTFTTELWISCVLITILFTFILWGSMKICRRTQKKETPLEFSTCFLIVCGGFFNQGFNPKIKSYSGRLQILLALIFGMIIYNSMNAVLVSQMAVFEYKAPFRTLEDIASQRTISLCMRSTSFVYSNFTDSTGKLLRKWSKVVNGPGCLDIHKQENVVKCICNNNAIVLENRVVFSTIWKSYFFPCDVVRVRKKLFPKHNTFVMSKAFQYKKEIEKYMMKFKSYGILQRIEKHWLSDKVENDKHNKNPTLSPITIHHIAGILFILAFTIIISIIILTIEFLYCYFTNN